MDKTESMPAARASIGEAARRRRQQRTSAAPDGAAARKSSVPRAIAALRTRRSAKRGLDKEKSKVGSPSSDVGNVGGRGDSEAAAAASKPSDLEEGESMFPHDERPAPAPPAPAPEDEGDPGDEALRFIYGPAVLPRSGARSIDALCSKVFGVDAAAVDTSSPSSELLAEVESSYRLQMDRIGDALSLLSRREAEDLANHEDQALLETALELCGMSSSTSPSPQLAFVDPITYCGIKFDALRRARDLVASECRKADEAAGEAGEEDGAAVGWRGFDEGFWTEDGASEG